MARLSYLRYKGQYNITIKVRLALFVNKAVGLKYHSIGFQATYIIMQLPHNFIKHVVIK